MIDNHFNPVDFIDWTTTGSDYAITSSPFASINLISNKGKVERVTDKEWAILEIKDQPFFGKIRELKS